MKLEKEVFATGEFKTKSVTMYHLVKLDFPRGEEIKQSDETKAHNQQWLQKLAVTGFPSLILLDKAGRPFAKTGFRDGGPEPYLKHLEELKQVLVQRDEILAKAEKAEGEEKAMLLDQALALLPEDVVTEHYEDVIKQIVQLDAKDKLGLRTKYYAAQDKEARKMILAKVSMAARSLQGEKALQVIDEALGEMTLPAMMKIEAMQYKLTLLRKMNQAEQAAMLLDEMIALEGVEPEFQNRLMVQKAYLMVSAGAPEAAIAMLDEKIGERINNVELFIAKGELLDRIGQHDAAIEAFDYVLRSVSGDSQRMAEVLSLKTEALVALGKRDEAIKMLDEFALAESHPTDLRADALVQKATLLREADRNEAAELAEQQALDLIEDPDQRADLRKYIEQLRKLNN
jgi:tetratricopeptide (TPR) repeat protein